MHYLACGRQLHRDHTGKIVLHLCAALLLLNAAFVAATQIKLSDDICTALGAAVS